MKRIIGSVVLLSLVICQGLVAKPVGLEWSKNNCFSNSLTQVLYNIPQLRENVLQFKGGSPLVESYRAVIVALKEASGTNVPFEKTQSFLQAGCARIGGAIGQQQDATELYNFLMQDLLDREKRSEEAVDGVARVIEGEMVDSLVCQTSGYTSQNLVPFNSINLPITAKNLEGCLQSFFEPEKIGGYKTEEGFEDCEKKTLLAKIREYLVISLKRFEVDFSTMTTKRIDDSVSIPQELNMRLYSVEGAGAAYELIGVVRQSGLLTSGHYTAYIKDQREQDPQWYHCDDSVITGPLEFDSISSEINRNGYMFFYKKRILQDFAGALSMIAAS